MSYGAIVDWLVRQPVPFFYGAFLVYAGLSLLARRPFDFMETAAAALTASAMPIGLAMAICALDMSLLPKVTAIGGFDLYLALLAMTLCYAASRAVFRS